MATDFPIVDWLHAETYSPLGTDPFVAVDLSADGGIDFASALAPRSQAIIVGIDRSGVLPHIDVGPFDLLISTAPSPPQPWVGSDPSRLEEVVADLKSKAHAAPVAASVLRHVLRQAERAPVHEALATESLAYSALLGGGEFRRWLGEKPTLQAARATCEGPLVRYEREGDHVTLSLCDVGSRNAMSAEMRDALFEALASVLDDPSSPTLTLRAEGACFSVGGELSEFGESADLAQAHAIRTVRSSARLLVELGERATVELHGACIGSGLEVPAAAKRRIARPGTFFQLPELRMGLIPGAGGTVSLTRAIGRHRTLFLALTGRRIKAEAIANWGLVEIRP